MPHDPDEILAILDVCCESYTFPMLDNGYFYLAKARLSLYRSDEDWALVIETFGFSPREGTPSTHIQTFASRLHHRDPPSRYVSREAFDRYLATNPHNEFRSVYPIKEGKWQDLEYSELVSEKAKRVAVRRRAIPLPAAGEYASHGIELREPPRVRVFELCRYLAAVVPEPVLATPEEQRISVRPEMTKILQLDEWHHPDLANDELPGNSETFRQLAKVLARGNVKHYKPTKAPNTHWRHWPDGGTL